MSEHIVHAENPNNTLEQVSQEGSELESAAIEGMSFELPKDMSANGLEEKPVAAPKAQVVEDDPGVEISPNLPAEDQLPVVGEFGPPASEVDIKGVINAVKKGGFSESGLEELSQLITKSHSEK